VFDEGLGLSNQKQQYDPTSIINELRRHVDQWRALPNPKDWQVTPETARLLQHWRHHRFNDLRPFFCQVEAAETAIWLTEAAPKLGKSGRGFLDHLANANNDPDSYYASRELVPADMLDDVNRAKIVITNYHAFKLRERIDLSKGGRSLLQGRGEELNTLETEGQMIQRVMPDLMGMKNILVFNDEAHHCYREKPGAEEQDDDLKGDDKKEAEKNTEAARLWISGLEALNRKLGVAQVIDLSATPSSPGR